jgi:hypothetical protein
MDVRIGRSQSRRCALVLAFILGAITVGLGLAACGTENYSGSGPPPLATSRPKKDAGNRVDADTSIDSIDASPASDAKSGATTYEGRIIETPPVKFGGEGFCEYTVVFKDVVIQVASLTTGEVIAASERHSSVEAVVPPCPHNPIAPNTHSFTLTSSAATDGGVRLTFKAGPANEPEASFVVDLVRNGSGFTASMVWKRIDIGPPFDWEVKATTSLQVN